MTLLDVLRAEWGWALRDPVRIVAINPFGNVVTACADGTLWRVCPEDLSAEMLGDDTIFAAKLEDEDFREDWLVAAWVAAARSRLGLGGAYTPENFVIKTLSEWLAVSGNVGRQVKDLPSGTEIKLDVRDA